MSSWYHVVYAPWAAAVWIWLTLTNRPAYEKYICKDSCGHAFFDAACTHSEEWHMKR
jgi:hypothetical protein